MNVSDIHADDALPLRAELFSALQMEQHGRILANAHKLSKGWARDHLLSRLAENEGAESKVSDNGIANCKM